MPKVFISHSWEDQDFSRKIAENLQRDGAEVWIDYSRIEGGDSLPKVIGKAIEWCDTLVLVWSQSAVESYFVELEWECALTNQKRVIPCVLDGARLPILLTSKLFLSFSDFNTGYQALARALKLKIPEAAPKPEIKPKQEKQPQKPAVIQPAPETPKPKVIFRATPQPLSSDEVKSMLENNDFYCKEYDWNKSYCNPAGKGYNNDFEKQKNGQVVYDRATGLMWQQAGSSEYMTYEKAEEYISQLNRDGFAGFTDWRLPTLEEAMSLMEPKEKNGDLFIDPIFDKSQRWIWTADTVKGGSGRWVVGFNVGNCFNWVRIGSSYFVRAVRLGQSSRGHSVI